MEPRKEDQTTEPRKHEGKSRFQIVKLEERIAPSSRGGNYGGNSLGCVNGHEHRDNSCHYHGRS